jgi:hypothetical protein
MDRPADRNGSEARDRALGNAWGLLAQQPSDGQTPDGVLGTLRRLCRAVVVALAGSGAGLSVMAEDGLRGVTTGSDAVAEQLEELQFVVGEGPCIDALSSGRPVFVPDLTDGATRRWPAYAPAAYDGGVRAVFAFPLQVGAAQLGIMDVFRGRPGPLTADEVGQALTFAEIAVTTLLDGQDDAYPGAPAAGLDEAIDGRAVLFQAQGMVMVQLGVSLAAALTRIRAYAFAHDRPLGEVARDIVARRLVLDRDAPPSGTPPPSTSGPSRSGPEQ